MPLYDHKYYMAIALQLAQEAFEKDETPTGCIIITKKKLPDYETGGIIGRAYNQVESLKDPTAHAEIIAITQAASAVGDWRLTDTIIYITKEPCIMCAGAIIMARIPTVVWGVNDYLRGAQSRFNIFTSPYINHRPEIISDILPEASKKLLQDFFKEKRKKDY